MQVHPDAIAGPLAEAGFNVAPRVVERRFTLLDALMATRRRCASAGLAAVVVAAALLPVTRLAATQESANDGSRASDTLLGRAGAYVLRFESEFSNVVSEERYEQTVLRNARMAIGGSQPTRREMRSDFLLVRLPEPIGWAPFRDVFEVDRQPIRDRSNRLMKLFVDSNAASTRRAIEITADSARYNIGIPRTMNQPVLALQVLRLAEQYRFQFSAPKADTSGGPSVVSVQFKEQAHPSLFSGPEGSEMPVHGRVWIAEDSGTVMKTELLIDTLRVHASIVTRYEEDPAFHLAVPLEMVEDYTQPGGMHVTARATYGRFRSFGVSVTDQPMIHQP